MGDAEFRSRVTINFVGGSTHQWLEYEDADSVLDHLSGEIEDGGGWLHGNNVLANIGNATTIVVDDLDVRVTATMRGEIGFLFCSRCGYGVRSQDRFCSHCGARLETLDDE